MKHILSIILATAALSATNAKTPEKGYRGFIEWSNDVGNRQYAGLGKKTGFYTGVSTSHGYQFNKNLYLGAGVTFEKHLQDHDTYMLPVFLDIRTDQQWGKFTPFGDFRIGGFWGDSGEKGFYMSPSIGYRINWGKKIGVNLGIGWTFTSRRADLLEHYYDPELGWETVRPTGKKVSFSKNYFNFRIGIDF